MRSFEIEIFLFHSSVVARLLDSRHIRLPKDDYEGYSAARVVLPFAYLVRFEPKSVLVKLS